MLDCVGYTAERDEHMLSEQELTKSPLFHDISYQDYREILSYFQAIPRSFRADELIYDFSTDAVGVVERGQASLIRIDEEGVATVLEDLGAGGVFGKTLAFAHGFNIHFGCIKPPKNVNVIMIAPKGPGHTVRSQYVAGKGVPCLIAVEQDATGDAWDIGLAYALGIGGARAGVLETTFRTETETDLFGEQAVLCGGLVELVKAGFETLVEAGYPPELAYFECYHEMKMIVDLMYESGIHFMNYSISNTAEYGEYYAGPKVINEQSREAMREILARIQDGSFAREFVEDCKNGHAWLVEQREALSDHEIEKTGEKIRGMFSWASD